MNIFQTFLRSTKQGTYRAYSIYVDDITPELLDAYILWRREIKQNSDATINHSLTPILKACAYACEMGMLEPSANARIQDMRIVTKVSLSEEESEFDGKSLNKEQLLALLEYHKTCPEPRRKEFLEIFFFAFHACGLCVVDVMTLQWGYINFEKKELKNIIYTTTTVEGYHRQLRKVTKNKGVFTSDTALEKLVYLAFTRIRKKWTQPVQNWGQTAQQLAILFPDRFKILA